MNESHGETDGHRHRHRSAPPRIAGRHRHRSRPLPLARRIRRLRRRASRVEAYARAAGLIALAVIVGVWLGHNF